VLCCVCCAPSWLDLLAALLFDADMSHSKPKQQYALAQLDSLEPIALRVDVIDRLASILYMHGVLQSDPPVE
jgi:hypothetical protein